MEQRHINLSLPTGLLEAALDHHRDALLDLAHILMDLGDPRGMDLLWRLADGSKVCTETITEPCCPQCGEPYSLYYFEENDRIQCGAMPLGYNPQSATYTLTGGSCGWYGRRHEMLQPLIRNSE